uniref:Annexin n=1 Tax=Haptolina brevifila TaxID=156173 RepID=A0A7S2BC38_9EUKA
MADACTRLQDHNRKLKAIIATNDAQAVNAAMNSGFLGWGTDNNKLITVLCSRTKSQLQRVAKRYREMYDKDIRDEVKGETGGNYGKMMYYAMSSKTEYVIDMLDFACGGFFNNYMALIELFVMCGQGWLKEGKVAWEGRKDKSLIDYINSELGSGYSGLARLLMLLLKGDREPEDAEPDDAKILEQVEKLYVETQKGFFSTADELVFVETIGVNNQKQNARLAEMYENKYSESLRMGIGDKMSDKLGACLKALLLKRDDFVASRLKDAVDGWGTNKGQLLRLLGGLDDVNMVGVLEAYEKKYGLPLASTLKQEIGGNFSKATIAWITVLNDPTGGAEAITEQSVEALTGSSALCSMCDMLLLENEMLLRFAAALDVEALAEAVNGMGTDDTAFIRTITTRSKRFLGRVSDVYREAHSEEGEDMTLSALVDKNIGDWYAYLAKFLVLQPSQSDSLLLDLALEEGVSNDDPSARNDDKAALIEFLCARHPRRVRVAKKAWEKRNDESLVDKLADSLHGDLREIALTMLKGKRDSFEEVDEEDADMALAKEQAAYLQADMGKAIEVLCSNSPAQNAAIGRMYEETYDMSLGRALGNVYSGDVQDALTSLLLEPAQWYASRLKKAFKAEGGVSNEVICRIIGAHDKAEIKAIALAYDDKYGTRLKTDVAEACDGNYKRLAEAWIDLPDQMAQPEDLLKLPKKDLTA